MSEFTPAQKRAYAIKMSMARRNAARSVKGYGAYRYTKTRAAPRKKPYTKKYTKAQASALQMDYPGVGAGIGGAIGSIFGPVGAAVGAGLGTGAQALIKHFTGFGDYKISKNSLMMNLHGNDPPMVKNVQRGEGFTITHREYITDITSSASAGSVGSAFNLQSFPVQPGSLLTFPWLSQVAANFQEYEINGMIFEFKSLSSDAVATSNTSAALGSVIMATDYNPGALNFTNKQEMLESEFSSDTKPSCSIFHPIECKRLVTPVSHLYVRTGSVPSGQDVRLYDFANMQIATQGAQATSALLGELWVTYQITFYKALLGGNASGLDIPTDKFQLNAISAANPLGTNRTLVVGSSIGGATTATTYTFPASVVEGTFLYILSYVGQSTAAITAPTVTFSSGTTAGQVWCVFNSSDGATNAQAPANTQTSTKLIIAQIITIGANPILPVVITFGTGGTLPASSIFADLVVTEINSNIIT